MNQFQVFLQHPKDVCASSVVKLDCWLQQAAFQLPDQPAYSQNDPFPYLLRFQLLPQRKRFSKETNLIVIQEPLGMQIMGKLHSLQLSQQVLKLFFFAAIVFIPFMGGHLLNKINNLLAVCVELGSRLSDIICTVRGPIFSDYMSL